jgi:hypothetical protein
MSNILRREQEQIQIQPQVRVRVQEQGQGQVSAIVEDHPSEDGSWNWVEEEEAATIDHLRVDYSRISDTTAGATAANFDTDTDTARNIPQSCAQTASSMSGKLGDTSVEGRAKALGIPSYPVEQQFHAVDTQVISASTSNNNSNNNDEDGTNVDDHNVDDENYNYSYNDSADYDRIELAEGEIDPIDSGEWDGVVIVEADVNDDDDDDNGGNNYSNPGGVVDRGHRNDNAEMDLSTEADVSTLYFIQGSPLDMSHLSTHTMTSPLGDYRATSSLEARFHHPHWLTTVSHTPKGDSDAYSQATLPSTLQKVETKTLRRQQRLNDLMHQLYCDVARLTALLGKATLERQALTKSHYQWLSDQFAQHARLSQQPSSASSLREESTDMGEFVRMLSRIDGLETRLTESLHRHLDRQRRKLLDETLEQETRQLAQDISLQIRKSDKRQVGVHRRWETLAGSLWARRWHEERASRYAAVELMKVQIDNLRTLEQTRGQELLLQMQTLRHQIAEERAERQRRDAKIMQGIQQTASTMQEALLDVFGDP